MSSNLSKCSLVEGTLGVILKRPFPDQDHKDLFLFSSTSFIIVSLRLWSVAHLKLIFLYNVVPLHVDIQLPQHHLLQRLFLPNKYKVLFLGSQACSIVSVCLYVCIYSLDYCSSVLSFQIRKSQTLLFSRLFWLFTVSCISTGLLGSWYGVLWKTSL